MYDTTNVIPNLKSYSSNQGKRLIISGKGTEDNCKAADEIGKEL
jgi:hypothetical protein